MTSIKKKIGTTILAFGFVLSTAHLTLAENSSAEEISPGQARARLAEPKAESRFEKMVDEATEVYRTVTNGRQGRVSSEILQGARCIAILPNVMTGAFIVGGTHGEGIASCKTSSGVWSQFAAISLNQGSLGLQAGAKSTDLVLFFESQEAENALKKGSLVLGSDVSVVAGKYGAGLDTMRTGVIAFSRTEGVFAGLSINDGRLGQDQDAIERIYGTKVDYLSILEGKVTPDTSGYSKTLTSLFP